MLLKPDRYAQFFLLFVFACKLAPFGNCEAFAEDSRSITLIIDFGDRAERKRFNDISWREKMTVLDAMRAAKQRSRITFAYRGSGRTALLTSIDGIKSEGARGENWLYRVNGKLADRSFGSLRLRAKDTVRWEMGKYP